MRPYTTCPNLLPKRPLAIVPTLSTGTGQDMPASMLVALATASVLALAGSTALAETVPCANGLVTVDAPSAALAELACTASDAAFDRFDQCDLGRPRPLRMTLTDDLDASCIGLFHCGEDHIEVLTPTALEAARPHLSLFGHMPADRLLPSVIHHELAHALIDSTACPYDSCIATSEYFAYTQQVAALLPQDRAPIEARIDPDAPAHRDSINAMILFIAPDRFILTAWAHFTRRDAACTTWQSLLDGVIIFDRMHP